WSCSRPAGPSSTRSRRSFFRPASSSASTSSPRSPKPLDRRPLRSITRSPTHGGMKMLSKFSLRTKLLAGFGAGTVILVIVGAVAIWGSSTQGGAATKLREAATSATLAERLKFQAADMNGWQTAYAFDIARGLPGARSDNAPSRKAFLAAEGAFDGLVKELNATNLDAAERAALAHVAVGGTHFGTV